MIEYDGWIIHSRGTREEMGVGEDAGGMEHAEDEKVRGGRQEKRQQPHRLQKHPHLRN